MDVFSRALASLGGGYLKRTDTLHQQGIEDQAAAQQAATAQRQAELFPLQKAQMLLQAAQERATLANMGAGPAAPPAPAPPPSGQDSGPPPDLTAGGPVLPPQAPPFPPPPAPTASATPPGIDLGPVGLNGPSWQMPQGMSAPAKRAQAIQGLKDAAKHYGITDYTDAQAANDADHVPEAVAQMKIWAAAQKPENETWTHENVMLNGKPSIIKSSNRGNYQTLDGKPISIGQIAPYVAPDKNTFSPLVTTGEGGVQQVQPFNTHTGAVGPIVANAKAAGGGMGGGMSLSPEDRQKMLNQAKLDNATMKEFENKVLAGKASVGAGSGMAGGIGELHGQGPMSKILAPLGNTAVGIMNPEYQKYLTAQRSYGRIMGNLQSKRYSDNQAEIERSIGGLGANDLAPTIEYKQRLRDTSLADPVIQSHTAASNGGKIDPAHFAQLSPADQEYFRKQGRAP